MDARFVLVSQVSFWVPVPRHPYSRDGVPACWTAPAVRPRVRPGRPSITGSPIWAGDLRSDWPTRGHRRNVLLRVFFPSCRPQTRYWATEKKKNSPFSVFDSFVVSVPSDLRNLFRVLWDLISGQIKIVHPFIQHLMQFSLICFAASAIAGKCKMPRGNYWRNRWRHDFLYVSRP